MSMNFANIKKLSIGGVELKQLFINGVEVWKGFTNMIRESVNSDKTPFVGLNGEDGYKVGYRLNTAGTETATTGMGVTGYIPVNRGDIIYLKNIKASLIATGGNNEHTYISLYNGSFVKTSSRKFNNIGSNMSSVSYIYDSFTTGADGYVSSFRLVDKWNEIIGSGGYMRISADGLDSNSIITINEPI